MDISIEAYRSKIGRFLPNKHLNSILYKHEDRLNAENNSIDLPIIHKYLSYLLILFLPVLFSIVALCPIHSSAQSYSHPLYPALPGCDYFLQSDYRCTGLQSGNITTDIVATYILRHGINTFAASIFSKISNFQSKYKNGNRKTSGIKISHWNKGPGHLQTKMPEIKNIINGLHPHIMGLSEANLKASHDQNLVQLTDYVQHTCLTLNNPTLNTSRVVVYTHRSLVVKVRTDLMCENYSSVWLEVGLPHHKKFLVGQTYREWQLPNQRDNSSLSIQEQLARWTVFLDQWERALDTGLEVHLLGDLNINHCNWTEPSLPSSNQTSKLRPLINALFSTILPQGVSQCVVGPTRHWPGQASSGLDHYYTNNPDKLSPVSTQYCGGSDHMLVFATRYSRSVKASPRYVRKRSFKYFNPVEFVNAVQQLSWLDLYLRNDADTAVELLTSKLTFILDTLAPMKTFQIRTKYAPWLSTCTVNLMKERDRQQKLAAETNCREDC